MLPDPSKLLQFTNGFNVLDKFKSLSLEEVQQCAASDRLNYTVLLLNLEKDLNIANCIRSAHLLGAKKVIVLGNNKIDMRGSVGSQNYIDLEKIKSDDVCYHLNQLKKIYDFVYVEYNHHSKSIRSNAFKKAIKSKNPLLIMGNEGNGIPTQVMEKFSGKVFHIEQRGVIRSLNVSSAASIVFHEAERVLSKPWYRW